LLIGSLGFPVIVGENAGLNIPSQQDARMSGAEHGHWFLHFHRPAFRRMQAVSIPLTLSAIASMAVNG
jgi:hypothetical protein